jgi:DnaK suppressor protein
MTPQDRDLLLSRLFDMGGEAAKEMESIKTRMSSLMDDMRQAAEPSERAVYDQAYYSEAIKMDINYRKNREIRMAIDRIKKGKNSCRDCGQEISPIRLKALPFATVCRECMEERDRHEEETRKKQGKMTLPIVTE